MATREIQLTDRWKRRLLHLRYLCNTTRPPELDEAELRRVEKSLGRDLGDPLLGLLAAAPSRLLELEAQLGMLPRHTKDAHEAGISPGLIGLGKHVDGNVIIAISALGTNVFRLHLKDGHQDMLPTEDWLDELIVDQKERLRDAIGEDRARGIRPIKDTEVAAFSPMVVKKEDGERLYHPKFGEGLVLREFGETKVEVAFDSGVTKTLMRSFLTVVDAV